MDIHKPEFLVCTDDACNSHSDTFIWRDGTPDVHTDAVLTRLGYVAARNCVGIDPNLGDLSRSPVVAVDCLGSLPFACEVDCGRVEGTSESPKSRDQIFPPMCFFSYA